jgi:hypothetical protein
MTGKYLEFYKYGCATMSVFNLFLAIIVVFVSVKLAVVFLGSSGCWFIGYWSSAVKADMLKTIGDIKAKAKADAIRALRP